MIKQRRMLIIEKQAGERRTLSEIFSEEYEIYEVGESLEALEFLQNTPDISVILLNLNPPDLDGFELLRLLKQNQMLRYIPVLVCVAEDDNESKAMALELGAADFITKPYFPKLARWRIQHAAERMEYGWNLDHDRLTGLYTREHFYQKTAEMMRSNPEKNYVVVCLDIERFKVINDLFGQTAGDRILIETANKMKQLWDNTGNSFGRLEADHFAMCFSKDEFDLQWVLEQFDECEITRSVQCNLSISFGVYEVENIFLPVDLMCDRAMLALKTIKGNYLKRWAVYDEALRLELLAEQEIVDDMNRALQNGEFCVYLQPIYSVESREPVSAEVLVRWNHPQRGMISPALFIPLFERNGFITQLDEYVWKQACRILAASKDAGGKVLPVSVNMSRVNFYNPNLCEKLTAMTREYQLDPSLLKLEITESAYTDNPHQLIEGIDLLQRNGFKILMDDFGSGYSSLNMLKDVPVDILKIDMKFVAFADLSGRASNILASVVRMAKWLDMEVVAEGVETKGQFELLRSVGCDMVQGYYFSAPISEEAFLALLMKENFSIHKAEDITLSQTELDALWNSSNQINLLFNGIIGGMAIYELSGGALEAVRVNDGFYKIMGCTPQSLFQELKNPFGAVQKSDWRELLEKCRIAQSSRQVEQMTIRKMAEDGHILWIDIKLRYLGTVGKRVLFYFAVDDVTEQRQSENMQSLYQYSEVIRNVYPEIVELNYTDNECIVIQSLHSSSHGGRVFQLDRCIDRICRSLHPRETELFRHTFDRENLRDVFECKKQEKIVLEARIWMEQAGFCWTEFTIIKIKDMLGQEIYLSCSKNIQKEKNAATMIEQNRILEIKHHEQQRYQIVAEQTGTIVLEMDLKNREFYADSGYEQFALSRMGKEELLSRRDFSGVVHEDDLEAAFEYISALHQLKRTVSVELRLKKMDGAFVWCRLASTVVSDEDGEYSRIISTINIIDDQKKAELKLKKTTAELQHLVDMAERVDKERKLEKRVEL